MGFLTDYEERGLTYQGKFHKVNPAYDIILNIQRMFREESVLTYGDKLGIALALLTGEEADAGLPFREKEELLQEIFARYVAVRERPKVGSRKRVLDFEEDGEYIYASFLQAYGIDLIEEQGRLSFRKFTALFQGLPEHTAMREIMKIRGREAPRPTRYNQEEIKNLMELKAYYALPPAEGEKNGLNLLFAALEKMAGSQGTRKEQGNRKEEET